MIADFFSGGAVTRGRVARIAVKARARNERIRQRAERVQIKARYEAAYWNTNRSYLPGFLQSSREDISALPRQEIMRRVRYFEKNSPVLLKILSLLDVNVVGSGITPSPATDDMAWNKRALDWWAEFSETADISGESDIPGLQSIGYRASKIDGDSFIRLGRTQGDRPALELVEAHRCGTGATNQQEMQDRGFKVVDGVVTDKFVRPKAFIIAEDFDPNTVNVWPASQIVQLYHKKRAGQVRGISLFHAAILDLHDLDDLQKYEMGAAKDAAAISKIIESVAGATTQDGNGVGASLQNLAVTGDITARADYYKQAMGAETVMTQPGDKYTQFESERPSAATTGFWDRLDNKIVQGSGVSYAALMDYRGNWNGGTLRAAVQSDNRLFNLETLRTARKWQGVWEYGIGWAMQVGELPPNPQFRRVRWHPPRRTTVDVGNDSSAMLEELKAGARSYEVIYGEGGEDWKERLEQRAKEEAFIEELALKYDIDRQYIASFAQERLAGQAPDAVGPGTPTQGQSPVTKKKGGKSK